jgi:sulfite reductase alpha subunit-like flavoprotein
LRDDNTYVYVCGLRGMEGGVLGALSEIAASSGIAWELLAGRLRAEGRMHLETY